MFCAELFVICDVSSMQIKFQRRGFHLRLSSLFKIATYYCYMNLVSRSI